MTALAQSSIAVSPSTVRRTPCHAGSLFQVSMWALSSKDSSSSPTSRLYSTRSWANRRRCTEFTQMALLSMFVGALRWAGTNTCIPRPCSMCIQAPTCWATTLVHEAFQPA